jgi:hypothetical protein
MRSGWPIFLIQVASMILTATAILCGASRNVVVLAFAPFLVASVIALVVAFRKRT